MNEVASAGACLTVIVSSEVRRVSLVKEDVSQEPLWQLLICTARIQSRCRASRWLRVAVVYVENMYQVLLMFGLRE